MSATLCDPRFPDGLPVPITAVSISKIDGEDAIVFTCYCEPNGVYKHKNFATEMALKSLCSDWLEYIKVGSCFYKDRYGDIRIVSEVDATHVQCTDWTRIPGGYRLVLSVQEERRATPREDTITNIVLPYSNLKNNQQTALW
jgi:hypothetical protein